ncbi:MAG: rRNA maturation RNase YbeY [Candidatus Paceibacterota bacterium]|jgi:probable rRNA maturation factor
MEFEKIKQDILGKEYSLSVAFVSEKKSREINKKYRNIDKPTNVLSFALDKNEGEIILCKSTIRKELKKFGRTFEQLVGYLVIHGMLHLKGMEHSSRMERAENKYDQKYFYRNRHGVHYDQSRNGRISKRRKKS